MNGAQTEIDYKQRAKIIEFENDIRDGKKLNDIDVESYKKTLSDVPIPIKELNRRAQIITQLTAYNQLLLQIATAKNIDALNSQLKNIALQAGAISSGLQSALNGIDPNNPLSAVNASGAVTDVINYINMIISAAKEQRDAAKLSTIIADVKNHDIVINLITQLKKDLECINTEIIKAYTGEASQELATLLNLLKNKNPNADMQKQIAAQRAIYSAAIFKVYSYGYIPPTIGITGMSDAETALYNYAKSNHNQSDKDALSTAMAQFQTQVAAAQAVADKTAQAQPQTNNTTASKQSL
jgi:hypothetical protein